MRRHGMSVKLLVASVVVVAVALGAFSLVTEAWAGCRCPMIYAPVKCDNGKIYSNLCIATCAHAHNCVPVGPGPVQ